MLHCYIVPYSIKLYLLLVLMSHFISIQFSVKLPCSTFRNGCEAEVFADVDKSACQFYISRVVSEHNHDCAPENYHAYPEIRRLQGDQKEVINHFL